MRVEGQKRFSLDRTVYIRSGFNNPKLFLMEAVRLEDFDRYRQPCRLLSSGFSPCLLGLSRRHGSPSVV